VSADECTVVFMGSPEFAVPSLEGLVAAGYRVSAVYTQPDRPAGRGNRLAEPAVKQAARQLGLPVLQPAGLRKPEAVETLRSFQPDVIVVAAFGQILRPSVIDLPPHSCLNVHASLLPRHRGAAPVAAAILAGDVTTGISIMQIDPGLDTGPIIAERSVEIGDTDTTGSLTRRLSVLGAELLLDVLPDWLDGRLQAVPQDAGLATLAPMIAKDAGRIDWTKPALLLGREVRAYNPWPLSATSVDGDALQILEAVVIPGSDEHVATGTAVPLPHNGGDAEARGRAGFAVQTGDGLLVPLAVRRAGRKTVSGAEFARGMRELFGSIFI
jgi:methionyl-tRNA formyltransferase